jgi:hypothetical protein
MFFSYHQPWVILKETSYGFNSFKDTQHDDKLEGFGLVMECRKSSRFQTKFHAHTI